jgi:hypothetical protein
MRFSPVRTPSDEGQRDRIRLLHNQFAGQRCFILGNGPSLNRHDLKLLANEQSFGVNGIFYKTREMGYRPTFYVVEDSHVIDDNLEAIRAYDTPYQFFLSMYRDKIPAKENCYFLDADLGFYRSNHPFGGTPRFSRDISECVFAGQSVTYINMQIAYYLGFTEIYLIGMDFTYQKPESLIVSGKTWQSTEDDPNHFHPDYFGKGKRWHDPQIEKVALNYENAKRVFERNGRRIMNATIGGQLEVFERVAYNSLFS